MGTADGLAFYNFVSKQISFIKHLPEMSQYVRDICALNDKEFVVSITDMKLKNSLEAVYEFRDAGISIRYSHSSCLYFYNHILHIGNWDNVIALYDYPRLRNLDLWYPIFPVEMMQLRINTVCFDNYNRLWCGSTKGMCIKTSAIEFFLS